LTLTPGQSEIGRAQPSRSLLDNIEQGAKIFATAAIPVIVALGGWAIQATIEHDKEQAAKIQQEQQSALDKDKISLEYVKIAKDILTSTEKDVPAELTTWSWRLLDGVSPIKFDKGDLDRLIARKERIPAPSVPSTSFDFLSLAPEYDQMFNGVRLTGGNEKLEAAAEKLLEGKVRYANVENRTGVPWLLSVSCTIWRPDLISRRICTTAIRLRPPQFMYRPEDRERVSRRLAGKIALRMLSSWPASRRYRTGALHEFYMSLKSITGGVIGDTKLTAHICGTARRNTRKGASSPTRNSIRRAWRHRVAGVRRCSSA
jgi:hypothetical protein